MQHESPHPRIDHIDTWRFVAVSMVFLGHIAGHSRLSFLSAVIPGLSRFGKLSNTGVLIFFVISGFVICRGLLAESRSCGRFNLAAFYARRTFRILPPLWLFLAVLTLLTWQSVIDVTGRELGAGALFLVNFAICFGADVNWHVAHLWSLGFEEQFYLLFPLLLGSAALRLRRERVAILWLAVMAASILTARTFDKLHYFLLYSSFLLTGCVCAMYEERIVPRLQRMHVGAWLALGTLLAASVCFLPAGVETLVKPAMYPLLIAALVLGTPLANVAVRKLFQFPLFIYFGKISYTVYLWQQLATANWYQLSPIGAALLCAGVWLLAHCSWQYVERPLIGVGRRWSDQLQLRRAGVAPDSRVLEAR